MTRWTEQAAGLYRGPVLGAPDDVAWSGNVSERLIRQLVRQLLLVARHWETAGDWQKGADALESALVVDPCAEQAARRLMFAYHHLGRPGDVKAAYQQCREALEQRLGVRPSAETEAALAASSGPPVPLSLHPRERPPRVSSRALKR